MNNTRKSQMIMVLAVNFLLSCLIGTAIWQADISARQNSKARVSAASPADKNICTAAVVPPALTPDGKAQSHSSSVLPDGTSGVKNNSGNDVSEKNAPAPVHTAAKTVAKPAAAHQARRLPSSSRETVHLPQPPAMAARDEKALFSGFKADPVSRLTGIRLTAVIGNKAMLSLKAEGSHSHERPEIFCLAAGEQVRTLDNLPLSVIKVEADRVVLDMNGERFVKSLPGVR